MRTVLRAVLILFAVALVASAQQSVSITSGATVSAAVVAAHAVDAHSSWGKCCEANPLLGAGRFGARHAVVKAAWVAGPVGAQYATPRRHRRWLVWVNFATAAALAVIASRNYQVPR